MAGTDFHAGRPEAEALATLQYLWDHSGPNAPDEYLCIVDAESVLLLHTARPETKGHFVGENVVLSDGEQPGCRLQDLTETRADRVGGYVSSTGREQIAAFVAFPQRNWVLGVHRSKAAFDAEVRSGLNWLGFAFLGVCGLLLPASLVAMHRTMRRLARGREQAGSALRESETRFRQLVENIHEVFWMENAEGTELLYVSPAYEQIWGRSCREFYENPRVWVEAIHAEDRQRVVDAVGRFRETGEYSEEFRIVRPDGSIRWISDRGVLIHDESGRIHRVAGIAEDITGRKRAETALRESEERYRIFVERNPHGIQVIDRAGIITFVNPAYQDMLGYTKEELLGKHIGDLIEPASKRLELREYLSLLIKEQPAPTSYFQQNRRKDGEVIEQVIDWNYSRDGEGNVVGFMSVISDITERKRVEEALRRSEAFLTETGRMAKVGGWEIDAETLQVSWTDEIYHIHELPVGSAPPLEEVIGFFHPDDRAKLETAMQNALDHGEPYDLESRFITARGKHRRTHSICMPITVDGKTVKLTGTFQDVTVRKEAEEALRENEARLRSIMSALHENAVAVYDRDGRILALWGCPELDERYGIRAADAVGKSIADFLPTDQTEQRLATLRHIFDTREKLRVENLIAFPGGDFWQESSLCPMRDAEGHITAVVAFIRDTTERKQAEKALRESERLLLESQSVAQIGSYVLDIPSGTWRSSPVLEGIFGIGD
ncbi:MAG: PAS domain S-box protein, partial [Planctomycetes bacterium]|nr:PAS domain S-box protein [Planctomycetota bacterium]